MAERSTPGWPSMRTTFIVLAFAAVLAAGCGAGAGGGNPFASFESRCNALGAPRFEVVAVPMHVDEVMTRGVAELTALSKADASRHRTYGLTTVSFGHSTQSELRMMEDKRSGRACGAPKVHVELSMQPAIVYLARELEGQPCDQSATREHEQKHVEVYRSLLEESRRRLVDELPGAIGTSLRIDASTAELKRRFDADLRDYMGRFMAEQQADMTARQAEIDTPEEYARVANACRG
jgi:hypothetical protein